MTTATRTAGDGVLTEAAIQRGIIDAVRSLGGASYHTTYAVGSDAGFPDLTCALPDGRVLFLEIKGPKGRLSDAQVAWLERLRVGDPNRAFVVWPDYDRAAVAWNRWGSVGHVSYDITLEILRGDDIEPAAPAEGG